MTPRVRATGVAVGVTVVAAGLWAVLAWQRPTVTYHLAPLLVSVAFPYVPVGRLVRRADPSSGRA